MSITLSNSAATYISNILNKQDKIFGLRLGINMSGCSGMTYVLDFVDKPTLEDLVFEDKGIKIVVNSKFLKFLKGTKLDFVKNGLNEHFKFINPNSKNECGCGESFNI